MILQSLVDYYEHLLSQDNISGQGYSLVKVSYSLDISVDGRLIGVTPLKQQKTIGSKRIELPLLLEVPQHVKRSSDINPNFLCDNSTYVLGVDRKGNPKRALKCFELFRVRHHDILDKAKSIQTKAVLKFLDQWDPENIRDNTFILTYFESITSGVNIVFNIHDYGYAHKDNETKKLWEQYTSSLTNLTQLQCLVTGQTSPIARIHPSIKGIKNAQTMGVTLVSFNAPSFESYGRDDEQGLNAPISEYAAFAYTTAINRLLSDPNHKITIGNLTVIFWALDENQNHLDIFRSFLDSDYQQNPIIEDLDDPEDLISSNDEFFVLGVSPNSARLSIRFFFEDSFRNILKNITNFTKTSDIIDNENVITLNSLVKEFLSKNVNENTMPSNVVSELLTSVVTGLPIPHSIYIYLLSQIRVEHDINSVKASLIKACLTKSNKEELTVSLNEQSNNKAYLLGRLFSVLEKTQQDAYPGLTTTIKEKYLASASATPATIFPILFRRINIDVSKSIYGYVNDMKISDLMNRLNIEHDPFPKSLSLDEQGLFYLGYYHQQRRNFTKKQVVHDVSSNQ